MTRKLKKPESMVDMRAERIAELREEAAEYQRLYRRHRSNKQFSLENNARDEYERCMQEIAFLERDPGEDGSMQCSGFAAFVCLPCLLFAQMVCVRSTAHVGELNERTRHQQETQKKLQDIGKNVIKSKYTHNRK